MRRFLMVVMATLIVACGDKSEDTGAEDTSAPADTADSGDSGDDTGESGDTGEESE